MRDALPALIMGVLAGTITTGIVWYIASSAIDSQFADAGANLVNQLKPQLRSEIHSSVAREVPPKVREALTSTLGEYGITPAVGRKLSSLLTNAERLGLAGVRRWS